MDVQFDDTLVLLHSHLKLDRDKGLTKLKEVLKQLKNFEQSQDRDKVAVELRMKIIGYIDSGNASWETHHGGLLGAKVIIAENFGDEIFMETLRIHAMKLTHHEEARVRQAAGELLGTLCQVLGVIVYEKCSLELLRSVEENLERHIPGDVSSEGQHYSDDVVPVDLGKRDSIQIVHESAGWRHLETSMRCLQHVIEGCGSCFSQFITPELLNLLFQALDHTNRFVRETGYQVFATLVSLGSSSRTYLVNTNATPLARG